MRGGGGGEGRLAPVKACPTRPARLLGLLVLGALAVVALIPSGSHAIYADQAGKFDWYQQNVGLVERAHFTGKSVVVASGSGVIASLSLRTSQIEWRTLLPESEVAEVFIASGDVFFTLSGNGKHASLWSVADGSLLWEEDLYSSSDMSDQALSHLKAHKDSLVSAQFVKTGVLVSVYDRVHLLSRQDGKSLWSWNAETDLRIHQVHTLAADHESIIALGSRTNKGTTDYFVLTLDLKHGQPKQEGPRFIRLPSSANLEYFSNCTFVETASRLFCLDTNGKDIWHTALDLPRSSEAEFKLFSITGASDSDDFGHLKALTSHPSGLILKTAKRDIVYVVDRDTTRAVHEYTDKVTRAYGCVATGKSCIAASISERGTALEIINGGTGEVTHRFSDPSVSVVNHGKIEKVFLDIVTKKDGVPQYRILVVGEDHSLSFFTGDKFRWTREEALASILKAEIIELPAPLALRESLQREFGAKDSAGIPIISDFVERVIADVQRLLALAGLKDEKHSGNTIEDIEALTKDKFGLRKLIIVTTEVGKIYALHSTDGSIAWSRFINHFASLALFLSRSSAHPPPIGVIVGQDRNKGNGQILQLNLITGVEVEYATSLDHPVKQSILLPYTDSSFRHPVLVVDSTNQGHIVPDTQENRQLVSTNANIIHLYLVDKEKASVEGYGINGGITKPLLLLWNVHFSSSNEVIEAIAPASVASAGLPVVMRGDTTVTPKYINKNLLAVATSSSNMYVSSTNKRVLETSVGVYLIDTVTGAIVYHTYQRNAQAPVHLIQGDNWVVYHLWNSRQHQFEMGVIELFEPQMDWQTTSYSSRFQPLPQVASQSYVFNSGVKAMGLTTTVRGLTQKQVIVGLRSDNLLSIDKRFLDTRRKPKELLTDEDKNEGVIPYVPELLFRSSDYLNYNNTIFGLRGVQTAPAYLESTSLVFAWGVDMFYTRVTPSGTFDMLNEDFEYYPLLLTVTVVVVMTIVTSYLVTHKNLREAWK